VNVPRDVFIRKIKTQQQKLVFVGGVYLGDEVGYREPPASTELFTTGKRLSFETRHASGLQTVAFADKEIAMTEAYTRYTVVTEQEGLQRVFVPAGDVEIVVDGVTSFTREQFFDPEPHRMRFYSDLDALGIDYIYAKYIQPEQIDDWSVARVRVKTGALHFSDGVLDGSRLFLDDGSWKFVISLPGVNELDADILVKDINVTFHGRAFELRDLIRFFKKS
jgi:hypothetical protein